MKSTLFGFGLACLMLSNAAGYLFGGPTCNYGEYGECRLVNREYLQSAQLKPGQSSACKKTQVKRCSRGTYVATALLKNFLKPIPKNSFGHASYCKGSSCVAPIAPLPPLYGKYPVRTTTATPATTTRKPKPKCTANYDANGYLVSGNCNTRSQTSHRRRKKRQALTQNPRDLLIMLDESGSVGKSDFENLKKIAAHIVNDLCEDARIAKDKTRLAVMSFDKEVHMHIYFKNFWTPAVIQQKIKNIQYKTYTAGRTCLKKALDFARNTVFTKTQGSRIDDLYSDVEQDIILITDGCANCVNGNIKKILDQVNLQMIARGINIYVLGVNLSTDCRDKIQVLGQGGNCAHFFFIENRDMGDVLTYLSKPHPCNTGFLVDGKC